MATTAGDPLGIWIQTAEEKADWAVRDSLAKTAYRDFERTAAELAGPDETLERVLLARLRSAYERGRDVEHEVFAASVRRSSDELRRGRS